MQKKDLNPLEFTLEIDGEPHAIRIEMPKPGDYIVYINGERTGHIYPILSRTISEWKTKDKIAKELVDRIGANIESLENNML